MKELSIVEKAKAYDEAIKRANELNYVSDKDSLQRKTVEHIFPQLKESEEDDRIRKVLRERIIRYDPNNEILIKEEGISQKQFIAWLEKQGEQKPIISNNALREGIAHFGITQYQIDNWLKKYVDVEKQGEQKLPIEKLPFEMKTPEESLGVDSDTYSKIVNECIYGEQKPTDKVEPKFKQGDWIVFNGLVLRVGGVSGGFYVTTSKDGITNSYDCDIDNAARLWTIQDAKDGDIIFSNDGHGSDSIEIIKSISDKRIDFWFCLSSKNNFKDCYYEVFDGIIPYTNFASREDATPATKEQRSLLFQKMKEAGYDWDSHTNKMIYNNDYRRLR